MRFKTDVTCADCGLVVPRKNGKHILCDVCARRRFNEQQRTYRAQHPERVKEWSRRAEAKRLRSAKEHYERHGRAWAIRKKYGLTVSEYDRRLSEGCAICGDEAKVIDHCHSSGQIRGPLCQSCNVGLGRFRDDPDLLRAAITYLEGTLFAFAG